MTRTHPAEDEEFAYLTTTGRRTGHPHTIEIWYVVVEGEVWMIAGGGTSSDWVRNLLADPRVSVRIGDDTFEGVARVDAGGEGSTGVARRRLAARYQGWIEDRPLSGWATDGLAVPIALDP